MVEAPFTIPTEINFFAEYIFAIPASNFNANTANFHHFEETLLGPGGIKWSIPRFLKIVGHLK